MKKLLLSLIFVIISSFWSFSTALCLSSLCDEWNVFMYAIEADTYIMKDTRTERLTTDTIIGEQTYVKLEGKKYIGALREGDNKDIYFIPAGITHEYLLYAFNTQVGDYVTNLWLGGDPQYCPEGYQATISKIEEVNGHRIFSLHIPQYYSDEDPNAFVIWDLYSWIEGIGFSYGGPSGYEFPFGTGDGGEEILCAYKNGEQVYASERAQREGCDIHADVEVVRNSEEPSAKAFKQIRDGQLYIIHNDKTYNASGIEFQQK